MIRATCGTTRPTNAIGPTSATAVPHSSTVAIADGARARPRRWPSPRATSSPSATAFSTAAGAERDRGPGQQERQDVCRVRRLARRRASRRPRTGSGRASRGPQEHDGRQRRGGRGEAAPASASFTRRRPRRARGRRSRRRPPRRPRRRGRRTRRSPRTRHPERRDRRDDGQRGPGVDAEDAGVGDRVARHPLDDGPRQPERGPGRARRAGSAARAARARRCGRCPRPPVHQGVPHGREGNGSRPDGEAEEHHGGEQREREREAREQPARAPRADADRPERRELVRGHAGPRGERVPGPARGGDPGPCPRYEAASAVAAAFARIST